MTLPDCNDWSTRYPIGIRKKSASHSIPGERSRYGVAPRCRWKKPISPSSGRGQVRPGRLVLLVREGGRIDRVDVVQLLLRREDQRVVRDRGVLLEQYFLRAQHGADVVDVVLDLGRDPRRVD